MKPKENRNMFLSITSGTQTVAMLVGPVVICLLLGLWLDQKLDTTPWLLLIGVTIGFSTSIWNIYQTFIKKKD